MKEKIARHEGHPAQVHYRVRRDQRKCIVLPKIAPPPHKQRMHSYIYIGLALPQSPILSPYNIAVDYR